LGSPAIVGPAGARRAERLDPDRADPDRVEPARLEPERVELDREDAARDEPPRGALDRRELPGPSLAVLLLDRREDPPARVERRLDRDEEPGSDLWEPDREEDRRGAEEAMAGIVPDQMNRDENEERGPEGPRSV